MAEEKHAPHTCTHTHRHTLLLEFVIIGKRSGWLHACVSVYVCVCMLACVCVCVCITCVCVCVVRGSSLRVS